jgi:hypothetical protein
LFDRWLEPFSPGFYILVRIRQGFIARKVLHRRRLAAKTSYLFVLEKCKPILAQLFGAAQQGIGLTPGPHSPPR